MTRKRLSLLVVALFACDHDVTPTPAPPKPFSRAELETMMSTQLDTYTPDLVAGHIENRANRRYTKRSSDGLEQSIVVAAGRCAPTCLSMHLPLFEKSVDPTELVPEAGDVGSTELAKQKLPDGRHGVAVFTKSKPGSGRPFARYTVYYNNGVNDLRVSATATYVRTAGATDLLLDVLKRSLERETHDALVSFIRYY